MHVLNDKGMSYAVARMGKAFEGLSIALGQMTYVASQLIPIVIMSIPIFRRAKIEAELGYRMPDWVWRVRENQRRTEGSGNGREMRA